MKLERIQHKKLIADKRCVEFCPVEFVPACTRVPVCPRWPKKADLLKTSYSMQDVDDNKPMPLLVHPETVGGVPDKKE